MRCLDDMNMGFVKYDDNNLQEKIKEKKFLYLLDVLSSEMK